jgi:Cft2 family RNA processing exonuclease
MSVSVKDRWVGPLEQVLNVHIVYQWYVSGKPSSMSAIDVCLSSLLHWLAQERNWVRTYGSVSRCAVDYVGSPFSEEQWLCPTLSMTRERLPRTGTARRKRMSSVHGLEWKAYVSCWLGFSPTWCTSIRIATTLRYEYRLFVVVIM